MRLHGSYNVHRNTIHYRIQHGQIAAQKVLNGKGEHVRQSREHEGIHAIEKYDRGI